MSSFSDRMVGRSKMMAGRMTGNNRMESEGRGKQMLGKMKDLMSGLKR